MKTTALHIDNVTNSTVANFSQTTIRSYLPLTCSYLDPSAPILLLKRQLTKLQRKVICLLSLEKLSLSKPYSFSSNILWNHNSEAPNTYV